MKHYILPVLLWTLAAGQTFAQKTLSPSALAHFENLPQPVQNMLDGAVTSTGLVVDQTGASSRNKPLQLDSTKLFANYPPTGTPDSTPLIRSIFQYPQPGFEVETQAQFTGADWRPATRLTTEFDAQDRIHERIAEDYDVATQTFQLGSKLQMFPRGNSPVLIDSVKAFLWDDDLGDWAFAFQLTNTFNAQDKIITALTSFEIDGDPTSFLDQYSYNGNGDNHLIESFLISNGFSIPTGKQEFMYLNHLLIQVIDFTSNGVGTLAPATRNTYAYDPSKLLIQQNIYTWVPGVNDWNPDQNVVFTYDNVNRLVVKETEVLQNGQKERLTFAYVEDENLALEARYLWNTAQNTFVLDNRKYYYYAEETSTVLPSPRTIETLIMSPNPSTGTVQFSMRTEAKVQVFDAAGHLVQSVILQPGESLNLGALTTGIYHVTARSADASFAGKMIKQ